MTDKELLELAAKAAGIENIERMDAVSGFWYRKVFETNLTHWNPLTDDGDALRLAVKLGVVFESLFEIVYARANINQRVYEEHNNDPYAATRLAIVRAAAEIGKEMK